MALKSEKLFESMIPHLQTSGKELVEKIGAVFFFEILPAPGAESVWFTVDLKNGNGALAKGKQGTADATFTLTDDDLIAISNGTLNPQVAFMQGKMKIKGNMAKATKFTPDVLPKPAKL
jgi:alkyl sulfatase BDS1-like metallo-beta-lactamase superfamily hydrolase